MELQHIKLATITTQSLYVSTINMYSVCELCKQYPRFCLTSNAQLPHVQVGAWTAKCPRGGRELSCIPMQHFVLLSISLKPYLQPYVIV